MSILSWFRKEKQLLNQKVQDVVVKTIADNEKKCRGEIRVYVESHCKKENTLDRCAEIFEELGMHQTEERNGVLLYIALKDRRFAIVGDEGINQKVGGNDYWQQLADNLKQHLSKGDYQEGICTCINNIGTKLAKFYPADDRPNINELPDEIVFGQ